MIRYIPQSNLYNIIIQCTLSLFSPSVGQKVGEKTLRLEDLLEMQYLQDPVSHTCYLRSGIAVIIIMSASF